MSDQNLIAFVKFLFDRYVGFSPDERAIMNALTDFRRDRGK